jgi:hypothetical protein
MTNERLRTALLENALTPGELASEVDVDTKTVERWVNGRIPHRRRRYQVAARLGVDEGFLWPDAIPRDQITTASASEILAVYPHRTEVPRDVWRRLFETATEEIGVLVYAGLFLAEDRGLLSIIRKRAAAGVRVRFLVGDPDDEQISHRGHEEGVGDSMAAIVRNAIVMYGPLRKTAGVEFRMHRTVLYNSIYRSDETALVNTHAYGFPAPAAPVWHLRRVAGGELAAIYLESFESVWETATPLPED